MGLCRTAAAPLGAQINQQPNQNEKKRKAEYTVLQKRQLVNQFGQLCLL